MWTQKSTLHGDWQFHALSDHQMISWWSFKVWNCQSTCSFDFFVHSGDIWNDIQLLIGGLGTRLDLTASTRKEGRMLKVLKTPIISVIKHKWYHSTLSTSKIILKIKAYTAARIHSNIFLRKLTDKIFLIKLYYFFDYPDTLRQSLKKNMFGQFKISDNWMRKYFMLYI